MRVLQTIIAVLGTVALAVTIVAAGFLACLVPPVTHGLAGAFSNSDVSPFDKGQLVQVADATREYSFGNHDLTQLYRTIYEVDRNYYDSLAAKGKAPEGAFPGTVANPDTAKVGDFALAFSDASDQYCYSAEVISHLDDCNNIVHFAYPFMAVCAIAAVAALVWGAHRRGARRVGLMLRVAGIIVLAAFAALGIWAIVDFNGFFSAFHGVFFSQGGWTFAYDSLLICALPTAFWMGMGIVWLLVSAILSILGIVVGGRLMHGRRRR